MKTVKVIYSQPWPKVKTVEFIRFLSGRRQCSVVGTYQVSMENFASIFSFFLASSIVTSRASCVFSRWLNLRFVLACLQLWLDHHATHLHTHSESLNELLDHWANIVRSDVPDVAKDRTLHLRNLCVTSRKTWILRPNALFKRSK